jgi:hypothetical protein
MTQRLIFAGSFIFAISFQYILDSQSFLQYDSPDFWTELAVGWFGYWGVALLLVWGLAGQGKSLK